MISCAKCQGHFLEALYEELEPEHRLQVTEHLAACPSCSTEFSGMQSTLQLLQQRKRPEPDDVFWQSVWDNITKRVNLPAQPGRRCRSWGLQPRWVLQCAAALFVIVAAFLAGRYFTRPPELTEDPGPSRVSPTHSQDPLHHRLDRYLERSKLLLLGLANLDPNDGDIGRFDFTPERTLCNELIEETYALKRALAESGDRREGELLSDLEVILLQISNLHERDNSFGVELAKAGIHRKAILFKINLEEMKRTTEKASTSGRRL